MREQWLATALKELETANLTADERMNLELDIAHRVTYEDDLKAEAKEESKQQFALKMLEANEPIEKVSLYTGLSIDEILQLK